MLRRHLSLCFKAGSLATLIAAAPVHALVEITDNEMSDVTGAGLAFVLDDFSMRFAPTSFIELTGTAAQGVGWDRGDARYYGLSITNGDTAGTDWYGNGCTGDALACPLGTGNNFGITGLASVYDPYVLRVFQYPGHAYYDQDTATAGQYLSGANQPTILELIGPSNTDTWRWSFWGELEVGRPDPYVSTPGTCNGSGSSAAGCSGSADFLQSQTIIHGKPVTADGKPAILRIMRTENSASEATFGINYQSAISGDFRFSVRQQTNSPDALHWVPDFDDSEGMHFRNVDAFLPLGTLHYQSITFDTTPSNDGNFVIDLTAIPNVANIYNHFYCGTGTNPAPASCTLDANGFIQSPNTDTQGYVRWGDFTGVSADGTTGANLPSYNSTTNGIYFVGSTINVDHDQNAGTADIPTDTVNLGISRIEGMRIHHLRVTTLGAGP